jgi:diguanylate cyclase (GGDEF)-like protein
LPAKVITVSLGIATADDTMTFMSYEELIKHADLALYKAKDQGRNQVQAFNEVV